MAIGTFYKTPLMEFFKGTVSPTKMFREMLTK